MDKFYIFIGRHFPEILAIFASVLALVFGVYFANIKDPTWLNRSGSLIIIFGVLLAVSRFHEWVHIKATKSIKNNPSKFAAQVIDIAESQTTIELNDNNKARIMEYINKKLSSSDCDDWINELAKEDLSRVKGQLKYWEVILVVSGTLINGFGDVVYSTFK